MPIKTQWAPRDAINLRGDPIPLQYLLPDHSSVSDWVLHKVKEIQHCVGFECGGFEEQFMALQIAIEVGHDQLKKPDSKKQQELKR